MKRITLPVALVLAPVAAFADTQLERFEALSDDMNTVMLQMFVNEIEGQGGDATALREVGSMTPDWTDEIRDAAACILDSYRDDIGNSGVDDLLENMEEMLPRLAAVTITEATENNMMEAMQPDGVSEERTIEIASTCKMIELQMEATQNSGFMDAMMAASATIPADN